MTVHPPSADRARSALGDARLVKYDDYIDTQIRSTRRMVKAVDGATVLVVTALGTLAFLLIAAWVEHWLVPDGFSTFTRAVLFASLATSVGYYFFRRMWPLCVRPINPVYAAQTIEHGSPSLKNSLLNLLLFRQHRDQIADAVYETLEQQAAERLVRVPVDTAVDRTHLLRLGYVLVAVVAAAAAYKIFSPKDPFVTAQRVLLPWADLVPASRVSISNVEPGSTTISRGEVLKVSAEVRGTDEDDPVFLRYTTADGQAVNRPIQMRPAGNELQFVGQIPDGDARAGTEPVGVAQNLRYRIEAGDARSLEYRVTVVAAPTITVERVDYDYPDYTGFAERSVAGVGLIRAIEGTQVTIHARANGPIDEAHVDFEADGRRDLRMETSGSDATASFVLSLREDRQTPRFASYVLRYTDADGRANREPVKYSIDVLPDYLPEAAILAPKEKTRDVRLDETVPIEVEARDPDFALGGVRILGEVAGRKVLDRPLLEGEHRGRFTQRFLFTPRDYDLQAGDVVQYWVAANDNRQPDAGSATSERKSLRIVSPDPNQPPPDRVAQRDQHRPEQGDEQSSREAQPSADGKQQQGDEPQSAGEPASAGGESGDGDQADDQRQPQQQQPGGMPGGGGNNESAEPNAAQQPGGGELGDQDSEQNGEPASAGGNSGNRDGSQNGERRDSPGPSGNEEQEPVSSDGDNDGEAFDRIRKFLQREDQMNRDGQPRADGEQFSREAQPSANDEQFSREAQPSASGRDSKPNAKVGPGDKSGGEDAPARSDDNRQQNREEQPKGPGAETKPGDAERNSSDPTGEQNDSQSPGGQQTSSDGPSGAGEQPGQDQGAPDSQPDMKPADKWQQTPSGGQSTDDQEPPAGGHGKRESDSQGDQGGDRAGGGEEGGGQQADREGTGSAGQNQSADEGGGESSERGSGNTSPNAGRDAMADDRTGESGSDEPGPGSRQRDGQGEQSGGKNGDGSKDGGGDAPARANGDQPLSREAQPSAPNRDAGTSGGEPAASPAGAGQPRTTDSTAPEADPANLLYAREQTDLVLETLAEQLKRRQVDKRLLDELGWSEREMEQFLKRWQQLKAAADADTPQGDAARRELDDALRSLGLGRGGQLQQNQARQDELRDLREGYRGTVPLEFQERLRAYNQGVSRARRDDE